MAHRIDSKCQHCGAAAVFKCDLTSYLPELGRAEARFKQTHSACAPREKSHLTRLKEEFWKALIALIKGDDVREY